MAARLRARPHGEVTHKDETLVVSDRRLAEGLSAMGTAFGQAAFKAALQQVVAGSVSSIYRAAVARG